MRETHLWAILRLRQVCLLVNEFWFSNLSSGVGVGLVVWYRTGGAVGGIGGAVR